MTDSRRVRRAALILASALSILALIQGHHRASKGRNALLKWEPAFEKLDGGEALYGVPLRADATEGYPTLPLSLLVMRPFRELGPTLGPFAWALFKVALAWMIVLVALALAAGRARDFPPVGALVVVLLSFRALNSDVQHGNLNIVVGATVAGAAWAWATGRRFAAGALLGVGAVLKVTPALGLVVLVLQRSGRGVVGFGVAVAVGVVVLPGSLLGFDYNAELVRAFWDQMIAPYVAGRELSILQTEHVNQSLLGVLARWTTDAVAIPARPPGTTADVSINVISLAPDAFRALHFAACGVVAGLLALVARREASDPRATLRVFSALALAMLFLSERSWKHHYVLLAFPFALLVREAAGGQGARRVLAVTAVAAAAVLLGLSGDAVLGHRGANLAEAYGAQLVGGLVLFIATVGLGAERENGSAPAECH